MLLPTKHLPENRAILTIAGQLVMLLARPRTVSSLWEAIQREHALVSDMSVLGFDWFILSLDFLFALQAIELSDGALRRVQ